MKEMEEDINRLQRDTIEQDTVNQDQKARIDHLEKIIEDLVDRVTKAEDKANLAEASTQRATRSTTSQQQPTHLETTLKA
jgi:archaellum component FlaC